MNTYTCVIVDDSEIDRLTLMACLRKFEQFKIVGAFASAEQALAIVNQIQVDVLFLDVEMPDINGIEFRKKAQEIPICIFISYSPLYAAESFEIKTLDYIVKPLRFERFSDTVKKIDAFMELQKKVAQLDASDNKDTIYIKEGNTQVKINTADIVYLEALKDYTKIITDNKNYLVLGNIGTQLSTLGFEDFIRIHRSFAVQKRFIRKIKTNEIILQNDMLLPIGKSFKNNLQLLYT